MAKANPYSRDSFRRAPSWRHSGKLPNVELYPSRRMYGGKIFPAYVKFSSGDAESLAELDEYISFLRKEVRPALEDLTEMGPIQD